MNTPKFNKGLKKSKVIVEKSKNSRPFFSSFVFHVYVSHSCIRSMHADGHLT